MTENCEDIQLCYYAAKLAQFSKLGDGDAFSALHDAIGKSNLKLSLPKIEDLAQNYSELSLSLLECKLKKLRSHSTTELDALCSELLSNAADMTEITFPSSYLEFPSKAEADTKESMKVTEGDHPASETLISDFIKADGLAGCSESRDVVERKDLESCLVNVGACCAELKTDEIIDGKDQGRGSNKSKKKKKKKGKKKSKKDGVQEKLSPTDSNVSTEAVSNDIPEESANHECCKKKDISEVIPPSKEKTELKPKNGIVSTPFGPFKDVSKKAVGSAENLSQKNAVAKDNHASAMNPDALESLQPEISFIIENLDCYSINKSVPIITDTVSNSSVEFSIDTVTSECAKLTFDTMPEHAVALPLDNVPNSSVTFPFDTVNDCVPTHKNNAPDNVPEIPENSPKSSKIPESTNDLRGDFNGFVDKMATDACKDVPEFLRGKLYQAMPQPLHNKSGKPPFDYHAAVEFLWNEWVQVTK